MRDLCEAAEAAGWQMVAKPALGSFPSNQHNFQIRWPRSAKPGAGWGRQLID